MSSPSVINSSSSAVTIPEGCVTTDYFHFVPWNNEDNLVPKDVDNMVSLLFTGILVPLLFLVSFPTNIINMVVFYKHGLKERINACLFTLSLVDLLSVTTISGFCSDILYMFTIGKGAELGYSARFFIDYYVVGMYGLVTASQVVYSVIALERCLCVTRPLLVKNFMATKTTVIAMWVVIVLITGCFVPIAGVRYNVMCVFDPAQSYIYYVSYPEEFYFRNQFVMDFLYTVMYGLFFPFFSLVCVTVCTVVTAVKLKKLAQWRETVSSASDSVTSRDVAITRMVVVTSILFIVCITPGVVMRSSFLIVPDLKFGGRHDNLAWVFRRFYMLGSVINNTFNFFVYYFYGSKFRETTRRMFSFCCRVEDSAMSGNK
ncbi:hypothetical protein ACOMHN_056284 [Nucella lapillus]